MDENWNRSVGRSMADVNLEDNTVWKGKLGSREGEVQYSERCNIWRCAVFRDVMFRELLEAQ